MWRPEGDARRMCVLCICWTGGGCCWVVWLFVWDAGRGLTAGCAWRLEQRQRRRQRRAAAGHTQAAHRQLDAGRAGQLCILGHTFHFLAPPLLVIGLFLLSVSLAGTFSNYGK